MQKLIIHQLGPVSHCELEPNDFVVFTGPQASGKSTVAKSIFFFKNIKDLLYTQLRRQCILKDSLLTDTIPLSLKNRLIREIRSVFLQIFGTTWCMDRSMYLEYHYTENIFIRVSLKEDPVSPNYIWIDLSKELTLFLGQLNQEIGQENEQVLQEHLLACRKQINQVFDDDAEVIYIPAGRSMITLLSTQLNYLYSSMDDLQKKNLDYCTQNYLERILQLKTCFSQSTSEMIRDTVDLTDRRLDRTLLFSASELMKQILKGEYRYVDGEERLQVSSERYVKINFSSSGQQESIWILNVLFYHLLTHKKAYFIIEEPEAHLFPNTQKLMTEFVAMAQHGKQNQVFITTHSPYILGTINNLLYAGRIAKIVDDSRLNEIIDRKKWIRFQDMSAYFIQNGEVQDCSDHEFEAIENEIIDGASEDINAEYDRMVDLKESCMEKGVVE